MIWVFEEDSFIPQAKIQNGNTYSIITDHLGTPFMAYDEKGSKVWECELDIYGKIRSIGGESSFIPFRYQGQYFDEETGFCYSRFRYYDPDIGLFTQQDPIGLVGGMPNMYAYVRDSNIYTDPLGLLERVIFPKDKVIAETTIKMQGSNNADFKAANENVGLKGKSGKFTGGAHKYQHGDVVWHHVSYDPETNTAKMQLVTTGDHKATFPHKGAVGEFMDTHGISGKYGNAESKAKANELNSKGKKVKCH